ncbi:MAG: hypothetical protein AAF928_16605 [Myxococcota bacterium]
MTSPAREEAGEPWEPYRPTLARARAEGVIAPQRQWWRPWAWTDLLAHAPDEITALAVVIIDARVQRRAVRLEEVRLPMPMLDRLETTAPEEPTPFEDRRTTYLLDRAAPEACDRCVTDRPGQMVCPGCGMYARTRFLDDDPTAPARCPTCDGQGYIRCRRCDGERTVQWARVAHVEDRAPTLRYAYVPSMVDDLDLAVSAWFDVLPATLPPCLQFDLAPRMQRSAYRGDVRQGEAGFHGFRFGDALPRALRAVDALGGLGEVTHREVTAYAWPLLWLRYARTMRRADVGLLAFPRPEPVLGAIVARPHP